MAMEVQEGLSVPHVVERSCIGCEHPRVQAELATTRQREEIEEVGEITNWFHFTACVECGQPSVYWGIDDQNIAEASRLWPKAEAAVGSNEQRHLAAAAELLADRGRSQLAALLLECLGISYRPIDLASRGDDTVHLVLAVLLVPPQFVDRFDADMLAELSSALTEASFPDGVIVKDATAAPFVQDGNWRDQVEKMLGLGATNQGVLLPNRDKLPRADRLTFGSAEEQRVYEVAKEVQAELSATETILVAPNPGVRVRGNTFTPDLLITYRGRVGIIEVDGPHHRKRYANDRSRDELFRDAGVAEVYRIPVEETTTSEQIREHLDRFLKRLGER